MTPPFESAPWLHPANTDGWQLFRVGTCHGQWRGLPGQYEILSLLNDKPGNGDFGHTMEYFYTSCKRDKMNLLIREVWNDRLAERLIKTGFVQAGSDYFLDYKNIQ